MMTQTKRLATDAIDFLWRNHSNAFSYPCLKKVMLRGDCSSAEADVLRMRPGVGYSTVMAIRAAVLISLLYCDLSRLLPIRVAKRTRLWRALRRSA